MKKFNLLLLLILGMHGNVVFSQEKPPQQKDKKVVIVKKIIDKNGDVKIEETIKEGDEADSLLEDMNFNIEIDSDVDISDGQVQKHYKIVKINEEGEKEVIKWSGNGDMPEDIKQNLKGDNIFLQKVPHFDNRGNLFDYNIEIDSEELNDNTEDNIFIINNQDIESLNAEHMINVTVDDVDIDGYRKLKLVIKKDGEEPELIEWEGDGDMPDHIKEQLKKHNVQMLEGHGVIELEVNDSVEEMNKAFLGVHIEDTENGALVFKVEEESAAQISGLTDGDVITAINDHQVTGIESLIEALKPFKPKDEVNVHYIRGGKKSQVKSVLKERPESSLFWISKNHDTAHENHDVYFFENGDTNKKVHKKVIVIKKELAKNDSEDVKSEVKDTFTELPEIRGKNLSLKGFNAYPNPTDDVINVSFVSEKDPILVQIFDISGKEVYRNSVQDFDGNFNEDINLSKFSSGNYILYVVQNEAVFSQKIVLN